MTKPTIGFIGLGLMGSAMVSRLQDLGYQVTVTANRSRPNIDAAVARGATEVDTARDVASASDIVMLCMDTSASVEARMTGADGVIAGLQSGAVVIDFGTSLPGSTRALAEKVAAASGTMLDGPLGRTPQQAYDGKLNIMASGDKAAFDKIKPVLDDLGENVFHLGAVGSGHTIKLMNNFFGMTVANAMGEVFAMSDVAGVDRQQVFDVIAAGPLKSMMMDLVKGYAIDGNPDMLAFSIGNAAKDLGYYDQMAKDAGTESALVGGPLNAMKSAKDAGHGDEMVSQMVDFYSKMFGQN
ncbi:NAD(P)-dependent oxidoreductase [Loktanella sp. F6476L]|uniref:NAD(P)-dependent oxidoreductase n=1 Tax=Loktanella sp. F6476L TaxID=2926405 RepID=UPI001FF1E565|nr:NAD(P)-dependent oxidoreductase [Loktanella sp. F6476L]MCK0120065.1 NAD(P)-dependent oxidoreductase [Loktanella sp. F6476L]